MKRNLFLIPSEFTVCCSQLKHLYLSLSLLLIEIFRELVSWQFASVLS